MLSAKFPELSTTVFKRHSEYSLLFHISLSLLHTFIKHAPPLQSLMPSSQRLVPSHMCSSQLNGEKAHLSPASNLPFIRLKVEQLAARMEGCAIVNVWPMKKKQNVLVRLLLLFGVPSTSSGNRKD